MLDKDNSKSISKAKLLFFIFTSIVPFIAYSGYYYYKMISKAPFRFVDFQYFLVEYNNPTSNKSYKYNSSKQILEVIGGRGNTYSYLIKFSKEDLLALHRYLIDNIFFDIPSGKNNNINSKYIYRIKVCYKLKCKEVIVYNNKVRIYNKKIDNIKHYIEIKFKNLL